MQVKVMANTRFAICDIRIRTWIVALPIDLYCELTLISFAIFKSQLFTVAQRPFALVRLSFQQQSLPDLRPAPALDRHILGLPLFPLAAHASV
jgi:hypothetical protein